MQVQEVGWGLMRRTPWLVPLEAEHILAIITQLLQESDRSALQKRLHAGVGLVRVYLRSWVSVFGFILLKGFVLFNLSLVLWHRPLIPALKRQRQADLCAIVACLVYIASCRAAGRPKDPSQKDKNKQKKFFFCNLERVPCLKGRRCTW